MRRELGKWGETLWVFANGLDETPVAKAGYECVIKGVGNSMTTVRDLENDEDVRLVFYVLAESVAERMRHHNLKGRTVQIYIRDKELFSIERQGKLSGYTYVSGFIAKKAMEIFQEKWDWVKPIRSIGVRVTDLVTADSYIQLAMFDDFAKQLKLEALETSIDDIRRRFGHYAIQRGIAMNDQGLNANPVEENIIHPVSYFR